MSHFPSDIDYLFEDDLPAPLLLLPAELRNQISREVLSEPLKTLTIDEKGTIKLPPLLATCRQLHSDNFGYYNAALASSDTTFEATVRDYNTRPLMTTLTRLAGNFCISKIDLIARTNISIVGELNLGNLLGWVQSFLKDPTGTPIIKFEEDLIPGYAGQTALEGHNSITVQLRLYEEFAQHDATKTWNRLAREFLQNLDDFGLGAVDWRWEASDNEIKMAVLKSFAIWHDDFRKGSPKSDLKLVLGKRKRNVYEDHQGVAELMHTFWLRLEKVRLNWA